MIKKQCISVSLYLTFIFFFILISHQLCANDVKGKLIWKGHPYAAFTSLAYYEGNFYCAFRNAKSHVDKTGLDCGSIVIIKSEDAEHWGEFLSYTEDGYDLRDPQLSVTPSGKLMLMTERVKYVDGKSKERHTYVSFINKDGSHSSLEPITFDASPNRNWIWNVGWIDGVAYGFNYNPFFGFVKSTDGKEFELMERIKLDNLPTESAVEKLNKNEFFAVVRTNKNAIIGIYNKKNRKWDWNECDERIDCPKIIKVKNDIFVVGRSFNGGKKTSLYKYNKKERQLKRVLTISGGRDCSYPGIVCLKGKFYISYYSGEKEQSDIFMAIINILKIKV